VTRDAGAGTAGLGLVAEAPSLGTSTVVVGAGGPGIVAGTTLEAGAAANVARIVAAPLQMAGGPKAANAPGVPSSGLTTTTICAPTDILGFRSTSSASGDRVDPVLEKRQSHDD
jgi:threonine dehydratase